MDRQRGEKSMASYESITYSRQEAFEVERDLRSTPFDMDIGESAAKMAYHLCGNAALIGEFVISKTGKEELIREGKAVLEMLCSGKEAYLSRLDKQVLATACVLLTRNNVIAAEREKRADPAEVWPPILEGLDFPEIAKRTQCSEQTARLYLCQILEDHIRFTTEDGMRFYNTLRLHALAPEESIKNLYNILYAFYRDNLECTYESGSNVASMFVEAMCRRWGAAARVASKKEKLQSDWIASSQRELFVQRPKYMAALCDALLERIDRIVQGDLAILSEKNRWDRLLRTWYQEKTENEKRRMLNEHRAVVRSRIVDRKENIRPEYVFEDGKLYLSVPGIRLPEIRQAPVVQLFQNDKLITEKKLPIYGSELLYHTRANKIVLDENSGVNWKMRFLFEIRIASGEQEIYRSGSDLFREYLCFAPGGRETRLVRSEQVLYLIARKRARLAIDAPQGECREIAAPYCCFALRTGLVRSVTLNGQNILEESYSGGKRLWAYVMPEAEPGITVKNGQETVSVYTRQPTLHVLTGNRTEGKNYQISINGVVRQLYECGWESDHFQVSLPEAEDCSHQVFLKDFSTAEVVFQRNYMVVSGLQWELDRPFYADKEVSGTLTFHIGARTLVHPFQLQPGQDKICWQMEDLTFEIEVPKIWAELGGKNAFLLPEHMWHKALKDVILNVRTPEGVQCEVVLGGQFLRPGHDGSYEIGIELMTNSQSHDDALLGLLILNGGRAQEERLTQVHFQEVLLVDPVVQDGRKIFWQPEEDTFIGGDNPVFWVELENDQGDVWTYRQELRPDKIETNFPCKTGTYGYSIWLKERKQAFLELPPRKLLEGEIYVEDPPEERFRNKHIILTRAYYYDPQTGRDTSGKMQYNGALIDNIRYVKTEADTHRHIYTGYLYFQTPYRWERFSDVDTPRYRKINPIFFTPTSDGHVCVWQDAEGDEESLEINLKGLLNTYYDKRAGIQIYSRKDDLASREDQKKYWACADSFLYIEGSDV